MTGPDTQRPTVPGGTTAATGGAQDRAAFDRLLVELRSKLHRYCARMAGSVIDGEDVLQETLAKAIEAYSRSATIGNPEGWLFRIAHNAALDFRRRRARQAAEGSDEELAMIVDPVNATANREIVATGLRSFMHLPIAQRSSVILMDVLDYSLREIADILDTSVPSVKAALHRGRERLRDLAQEPDDRPASALTDRDRSLLATYVERFNARDFAAIRDMLADEVRLELVAKSRMSGRAEVSRYFHNYSGADDWHLRWGFVEGRPAALVNHPSDPSGRPAYFILLNWAKDGLLDIRDFRYARYAMDGADLRICG